MLEEGEFKDGHEPQGQTAAVHPGRLRGRRSSRRPTSCGPGRTCTSTRDLAASDERDVLDQHGRRAAEARRRAQGRTRTSRTRACCVRAGSSPTRPITRSSFRRSRPDAARAWASTVESRFRHAVRVGRDPDQNAVSRTTTAGSSAPGHSATSSTWCACSRRSPRTSASAAATWTCSSPAGICRARSRRRARRHPASRRRAARARRASSRTSRSYLKYENWADAGYPQPIQTGDREFPESRRRLSEAGRQPAADSGSRQSARSGSADHAAAVRPLARRRRAAAHRRGRHQPAEQSQLDPRAQSRSALPRAGRLRHAA